MINELMISNVILFQFYFNIKVHMGNIQTAVSSCGGCNDDIARESDRHFDASSISKNYIINFNDSFETKQRI